MMLSQTFKFVKYLVVLSTLHLTLYAATPQVSAGIYNSFLLKGDGTLWSWGKGQYGELGYLSINSNIPKQVGTSNDWKSISAADVNTFALKKDGTLWRWGLAIETLEFIPRQITTRHNWSSISASEAHVLALSEGKLYYIGPRRYTQIGEDSDWKSISAGALGHSLALKNDNTLWKFQDINNQLTQIEGSWKTVLAGLYYFYLIREDDSTLWKIPYNNPSSLIQIEDHANWEKLAPGNGRDYILAIKKDGSMYNLKSGVLQVENEYTWQSAASGRYHALALKQDNTLWTWGTNAQNQLGDGSTRISRTPKQVNLAPDIIKNRGLKLDKGTTRGITTNILKFSDDRSNASQIIYIVTQNVHSGSLKRSGETLDVNDSFRQSDIDNGYISYEHDDSRIYTDQFSFKVSDYEGAEIVGQVFAITIKKPAINYPTLRPVYPENIPNLKLIPRFPITKSQPVLKQPQFYINKK